MWRDQGVLNVGGFMKALKQRMIDTFIEEWTGVIRNKDRYALYSHVKSSFSKSAYVDNIDIYCFRVAFCQTRLGVLPLNNSMNRYGYDPLASMCPFCKNQVEDELHFFSSCPV